MKGLFPQYDYTASTDQAETWKTALFVFDTNVLLNLYRYHERTREELLETLEKLSERIWIPHHVALEFQRNRLTVIAAQGRRFSEIRKVIEKTKAELANSISNLQLTQRHALINPEPLTTGFETLTSNFLAKLEKLQNSQQTLTAPDPIKIKIEDIFDGKVGAAFASQADVDQKNKEAEARYKSKIPPGYKDSEKGKDGLDDFNHNGITYKKKFGDYFVWSQLLDYAASSQRKKLIFITDDAKEDWWQTIDFNGPKTIGPRTELIEEARRIGKLDTFLMYKPETFLKHANEYLAAKVSEETLTEVRDVSYENKKRENPSLKPEARSDIERAIFHWLLKKHTTVTQYRNTPPDFIICENDVFHGFEIKQVRATSLDVYEDIIMQAQNTIIKKNLSTLTTIFMIDSSFTLGFLLSMLSSTRIAAIPENLIIVFGQIEYSLNGPVFDVAYEGRYSDILKNTAP
jgi:predicted nucleic acid-binding protein